MVQKSKFNHDLKQEQILGRYLDKVYKYRGIENNLVRVVSKDSTAVTSDYLATVASNDLQSAGVDLVYSNPSKNNGFNYNIDEKAQLSRLNKSLPTFAFELSYMFNGNQKKGWLFDATKTTHYYFLVTRIFLKNGLTKLSHEDQVAGCTITKVHRDNLKAMLCNSTITNPDSDSLLKDFEGQPLTALNCEVIADRLRAYENNSGNLKKIRLNQKMKVSYSGFLKEKPINIVIRLDHILEHTSDSSQKDYKTGSNGEVSFA